jgi:type 1 glutamine amidotransferase
VEGRLRNSVAGAFSGRTSGRCSNQSSYAVAFTPHRSALDPSKTTSEQASRARADGYLPIVWAKNYGKGRVFNMTGGHNEQTVDDRKFQGLLLEGIEWALGLRDENVELDR